jgi:hypothetical protein
MREDWLPIKSSGWVGSSNVSLAGLRAQAGQRATGQCIVSR